MGYPPSIYCYHWEMYIAFSPGATVFSLFDSNTYILRNPENVTQRMEEGSHHCALAVVSVYVGEGRAEQPCTPPGQRGSGIGSQAL